LRNGKEALRITKLELRNWKNFAKVSVALHGRVFLVGPNASGKSNLLDVFRFLHDIVSVGGGFQEAVRKRGGVSQVRSLVARRFPEIEIHVNIGTDSEPDRFRYELHFKQDKQRRPLITHERVMHAGEELLIRPDEEDEKDAARLTQTYLEQVNVNKPFREVVQFFESVRYLHLVPQLVREPDRSVGRSNDPYGGDFLQQVAATPGNIRTSRLRRIEKALRIAVPQLKDLSLERDEKDGVPHLVGIYEHWRPHGARQSEEQFSDGTLRLLGLLWAVLEKAGPLLLEEPELSLHPAIVRHLPQMFARMRISSGRQVVISTHSTELLEDSGIGLNEVLLLLPEREGTAVTPAGDIEDARTLLESGLTLADAVVPATAPRDARQLSLFE